MPDSFFLSWFVLIHTYKPGIKLSDLVLILGPEFAKQIYIYISTHTSRS
jgi:hypothetical protein